MDDLILKTSKSKELLRINIDHFLTFNEHVSKLCKKASQKLHTIARISSYLNKNKFILIINAFFCPSLDIGDIRYNNGRYKWYNRRYNNKINRLHKPILRIVYKDYKSSFA